MKNCQMVWDLAKEKDEDILKHLKNVETKRTDEPKTLSVIFHFDKNDYFAHDVLTLKLHYKGDENDVTKVEGTQIVWAEGKDPTKKKVKKKQKNKKTNETRTIVKTVEDQSFFNVFQNIDVPEGGFEMNDEEDEDDMQGKVDAAMNLAEDIDEVLMEDALEYYLGLNDDIFDEDGDDDDSEPSEGDDSDGGDKKKPKKKGGKDKKEEGGQQQQQECKQQ
jgi:nucleosome assembly protein 1-like 1